MAAIKILKKKIKKKAGKVIANHPSAIQRGFADLNLKIQVGVFN